MSGGAPILSLILLVPFLGAFAILFLPRHEVTQVRRIAVGATLFSLVLAFGLLLGYDVGAGGFQFVEKYPWVRSLGISFQVGVDGINLVLVLLHAICAFTGVLISYAIKVRVKEYYIFYLLLITGVFGVFTSLDLFFFYFFYEMAVIPMYPLIGIWGSGDKEYAGMKLTLYLTAGAVLGLVGLLIVYFLGAPNGLPTFDFLAIQQATNANPISIGLQRFVFPFLLLGFGVMAPMWPFHSWSPIGHAAAPSAVSMLHAGVLMKLGSYAILRLAISILPEGAIFWLPWVALLALMNIIYGGFVAMAQKDMKFIIGYSSSSHMGYVLLGLAVLSPLGVTGAVLLMFAHGIMTALAFALIGHVYDRSHTRMVSELGGLAQTMPFVAFAFVVMAMASSGLPGLGNFAAEIVIFFGAWEKYPIHTILAAFGVIITSVYMLRMVRGVFFGELSPKFARIEDATTPFDRLPYGILMLVLLVVGVWPTFLLKPIQKGAAELLAHPSFTSASSVARVGEVTSMENHP